MVQGSAKAGILASCAVVALTLAGCSAIGDPNAGAGLYPMPGGNDSAAYPAAPPSGGLPMPGPSGIRMPSIPGLGGFGRSASMPLPDPPRNGSYGYDFGDIGYATWSDDEPSYRVYPGDELEVTVPSAPELSKTLTVQPDGRVSLPLLQPVMAADRSLDELQQTLTQAYSSQLLRPTVNLSLKSTTPLKVYVGGEVNNPGIYDMAGDGDALRAIIQAGGFRQTGAKNQVAIIRRGSEGLAMMRTADLSGGLDRNGPRPMDLVPLRRFDIVYVPRTRAAEAAQFVQTYFRDISPVTFGFNYAINGLSQ
jgi:protein involved in polysaccharide export with SLBB domain